MWELYKKGTENDKLILRGNGKTIYNFAKDKLEYVFDFNDFYCLYTDFETCLSLKEFIKCFEHIL